MIYTEDDIITDGMNEPTTPSDINPIQYKIEGNIDFYSQIYDTNINEPDIENICLITGEPLSNHHQTLQCNHTFNYIPLYLYVKQSKYKFNYLEHTPLKINQLKCPYCRQVQNELLPYIEEFDFPKIPGVNHLDAQYKSFLGRCEYVTSKKVQCLSNRVYLFNGRCYCYTHRNIVIHREHKQLQLYKLTLENKKQTNISPTNLMNNDSDKSHPIITDTPSLEVTNPSDVTPKRCTYIFIKGIKKGFYCNRKINNINETYCKEHKK